MSGKPPDFQLPSSLVDIYAGHEKAILGPDWENVLKELVMRERTLERAVQAPDERFSLDGPLVLGPSPHAEVRYGGTITEVVARLAVAGTGATTIDVYLNGSVIGTVTIASGDTRGEIFIKKAIASRVDALWVDVTAFGTGTERLVVYVRIIPDARGAQF